jgi:hypothetical protein
MIQPDLVCFQFLVLKFSADEGLAISLRFHCYDKKSRKIDAETFSIEEKDRIDTYPYPTKIRSAFIRA